MSVLCCAYWDSGKLLNSKFNQNPPETIVSALAAEVEIPKKQLGVFKNLKIGSAYSEHIFKDKGITYDKQTLNWTRPK